MPDLIPQEQGRAARRYEQLTPDRDLYLDRARDAGQFTLPYLIPESNEPGHHATSRRPAPFNGIGQRGVLNLASRMLLALLPPTEAFFRFTINESEALRLGLDEDQKREMERALSRMEREVLLAIEASNDRVALHEGLLWLLVAGNVLLYVGEEGLRVYHLNRYVCSRDAEGRPMDAVTCEVVAFEALPADVQEQIRKQEDLEEIRAQAAGEGQKPGRNRRFRVYTLIEWGPDRCTWHQEVQGIEFNKGSSTLESCPWLPLRMSRIDGEPYGVGYVEQAALADLKTLDALTQATVEGSLASAIIRFLVRPNGVTKATTLANAANGAFVPGDPNDVAPLQVNKLADFQFVGRTMEQFQQRLAQAFLLVDVRDSERTTAEEVRLQALQLENGLGAIYAVLSQEFQQPYVKRKLDLLIRAGKLKPLPEDLVRPVVSVGLAAVGRNNDLERVVRFVTLVGQSLGPEAVARYINPSEMLGRLATSMGMNTDRLVRTEEEIQAAEQQAQQLQLAQQAMISPAADPQRQAQAEVLRQQAEQPAEPIQ